MSFLHRNSVLPENCILIYIAFNKGELLPRYSRGNPGYASVSYHRASLFQRNWILVQSPSISLQVACLWVQYETEFLMILYQRMLRIWMQPESTYVLKYRICEDEVCKIWTEEILNVKKYGWQMYLNLISLNWLFGILSTVCSDGSRGLVE